MALAGRRIDAADAAEPRFPAASIAAVRSRLLIALVAEDARILVCSAACGADLLALEEAGRMGIRRKVVLPFTPARFREISVVDRSPGEAWGDMFDRVVQQVGSAGDLLVLASDSGEVTAFEAANEAILREARAMAETNGAHLVALSVWEGTARGADDATEGFRRLAAESGFALRDVPTR